MTPKKPKEFYKLVADKLGYDIDDVEKVVDHYWSNMRKTLLSHPHPYIRVEEMGYFRIRPVKIKDKIDQRKRYLQYLGNVQDFKKFEVYSRVSNEIEAYEKLYNVLINDIEERKKFKKINYEKFREDSEENYKANCSDS